MSAVHHDWRVGWRDPYLVSALARHLFGYTLGRAHGGGGGCCRQSLSHGALHHDHPRTRPHHPRYRLPLLACVHAGRLRIVFLCRTHGRHGCLPQRRQRPWRHRRGLRCRRVTLGLGQFAFASIPSALIRAAIALLFAVPAAITGYHATLGLAHMPSAAWHESFSVVGAGCIGCTTFIHMAAMALPPALGQAISPEPAQPRLTGVPGRGVKPSLLGPGRWRRSGRSHSVYPRGERRGDLDRHRYHTPLIFGRA
jgi:hypothetical protein